jgi:hypothetical protein
MDDFGEQLKAKMAAASRQRALLRKRERRDWARDNISVTKQLHGRCVVYAIHRRTIADGTQVHIDSRPDQL